MKKFRVFSFFDHRDSYIHGDLRVREVDREVGDMAFYGLLFDESTTNEEMVRTFLQEGRLLPLDDSRLRYNLVLQAFESYSRSRRDHFRLSRSLSKPVTFKEGQTLASTQLTHLVTDESEVERRRDGEPRCVLYCAISIEIRDTPPQKRPSGSAVPSRDEVMSIARDLFVTTVAVAATVSSIIGGLDVIERRWREWRTMHHAYPFQGTSQTSESDIVAIRLRMTHGPDHEFEEWLTDLARLKHYIDVFNQPSSSIKPLQAIFVQRNGKALKADVSEGVQNNLQLNELLSYLNIDPGQK